MRHIEKHQPTSPVWGHHFWAVVWCCSLFQVNFWEWPAEQEDQDRWLKDRLDFAEKNEKSTTVLWDVAGMTWDGTRSGCQRICCQDSCPNAMAKERETFSRLKFASWVNMSKYAKYNLNQISNMTTDARCEGLNAMAGFGRVHFFLQL
jgi:hypothetical protein